MTGRHWWTIPWRHCNRFDPVNSVLKAKKWMKPKEQLVWQQRIGRCCTNVQKERAVFFENSGDFGGPKLAPAEVFLARQVISVRGVIDLEVIRWRGDNDIHGAGFETGQLLQAIAFSDVPLDCGETGQTAHLFSFAERAAGCSEKREKLAAGEKFLEYLQPWS